MGSGGRAAVSRTALSPEISIVDARFRPPGASRRRPADRTRLAHAGSTSRQTGLPDLAFVYSAANGENADPDSKAIDVLIWRGRYVTAAAGPDCGPSVARARFSCWTILAAPRDHGACVADRTLTVRISRVMTSTQ